jgi:hypothetical protein
MIARGIANIDAAGIPSAHNALRDPMVGKNNPRVASHRIAFLFPTKIGFAYNVARESAKQDPKQLGL